MPEKQTCDGSVCVIIDGDYLAYALHTLKLDVRYDFKALKAWLLNQRPSGCVTYYCGEIRNDRPQRLAFYDVLRRSGMRVCPVFHRGSRESSAVHDEILRRKIVAKMTWDMCECTQRGCRTLVLVSGAPGLATAVGEMRRKGVIIELVFFRELCYLDLLSRANYFRNLRTHGLSLQQGTDNRVDASSQRLSNPKRKVV